MFKEKERENTKIIHLCVFIYYHLFIYKHMNNLK